MKVLTYSYRDVFHSSSLGLRVRKWLVAFPFVLTGLLWWTICAWLALLSRGFSFGLVWRVYGPIPWPSLTTTFGFPAAVLWITGLVGATVSWLFACIAVGRMTYQQLKGNEFFGVAEAWRFARRKLAPTVVPPAFLAVGGIVLALILLLLAALGRVWTPLLGPVFPVAFLVSLALLYVIALWVLGLLLAPAIVASSSSETLETMFEIFSLQSSQGKRSWWYSFLGLLLSTAHTLALGVFMGVGALLASWALDAGHAGAAGRTLRQALAWAPRVTRALNGVPGVLDALCAGLGLRPSSPPTAYGSLNPPSTLGATVVAAWMFLLAALLVAQFLVTFATSQTASYVVLRQLKDEQNLLEEDLEE